MRDVTLATAIEATSRSTEALAKRIERLERLLCLTLRVLCGAWGIPCMQEWVLARNGGRPDNEFVDLLDELHGILSAIDMKRNGSSDG